MVSWRQTFRSMAMAPGYSVTALLTLGLTVGVSTGAFRIVYGAVLRPLVFQEPDPLVLVELRRAPEGGGAGTALSMSFPEFRDWRARSRTVSDLALSGRWRFAVDAGAGGRLVDGAYVSDGFFRTFRQPMVLGRAPSGGVEEVAVGEGLWRNRLGGGSDVIGRAVRIDGRVFTVVGVVSADFRFLDQPAEIWAPLELLAGVESRDARWFTSVGRLMAGVEPTEARAEAEAVSLALAEEYPESNGGVEATVTLVSERLTAAVRPALVVVAAAAGLLLVAGAAGLGNLLAVRSLRRSGETTTRVALGASWTTVARGFAAEAGLLALGGTVIGLVLWSVVPSVIGRDWLSAVALGEYGHVDGTLVAWAVVSGAIVVVVSGIAAAVVIAWHGSGGSLGLQQVRGGGRASRSALRAGVVGQVAISFVLVQAAASLGLHVARLLRADIGVSADGVSSTELVLASGRRLTADQRTALVDDVVDRVSALPEVEAAAASLSAPPNDMRGFFEFDQLNEVSGRSVRHQVDLVAATPAYFDVLGIPLLRGRVFSEADDSESPRVVVLSDGAARRFFGREDPVGRMLAGAYRTVVGVVGDVRYNGRTETAADTLYFPLAQYPVPVVFLLTRGFGGEAADVSDVAAAVHERDRGIAVGAAGNVGDPGGDAIALPSVLAWSVAALAVLALIQTVVALYGLVAYTVSCRRQEFAVRLALGAGRSRIAGMVMREGAWLAATGLGLGVVGAVVAVRGLGNVLYGVTSADPIGYVVAAVLVFSAALAGTVRPAWKATSGDPALALRSGVDG